MYRCHIDSLTQNFQDAKTATEAGLAKFPAGALRRRRNNNDNDDENNDSITYTYTYTYTYTCNRTHGYESKHHRARDMSLLQRPPCC